jgi:hypothetical protein
MGQPGCTEQFRPARRSGSQNKAEGGRHAEFMKVNGAFDKPRPAPLLSSFPLQITSI